MGDRQIIQVAGYQNPGASDPEISAMPLATAKAVSPMTNWRLRVAQPRFIR
jgi:hypothetical protein